MKRFVKLSLCLLFITSNIFSQCASDSWGIWYTLQGTYKFNEKYSVSGLAQLREYQMCENLNYFFVEGDFNYHLNKRWSLTAGYLYGLLDTSIDGPDKPNMWENRFLEQVRLNTNLGKLPMENRLRFEQRILNKGGISTVQHRLRYRLKLKIPINKTFYVSTYEEIILNISHGEDMFQQNRLYGAIGIKVFKHCNVELGYMKHHFLEENLDRVQVGVYFY